MDQLILIVENGMMDRKKISADLKRDGYQVQFASDAASALTIFNHARPFFILVSLIMLKIDSRTFSRIIKNDDDTKDTTIIGFSGESNNKGIPFYSEFDGYISLTESSAGIGKALRNYLNQLKRNNN